MLKQAWCNKQDLITQPGNNEGRRKQSLCKHLRKMMGECKYLTSLISRSTTTTHAHAQLNSAHTHSLCDHSRFTIRWHTLQYPVIQKRPPPNGYNRIQYEKRMAVAQRTSKTSFSHKRGTKLTTWFKNWATFSECINSSPRPDMFYWFRFTKKNQSHLFVFSCSFRIKD